jgi:hypothetical protein
MAAKQGKALANPTMANILALDGVAAATGSVLTWASDGRVENVARADMTVGNATTAATATTAALATAVGLSAKKSEDVGSIAAGAAVTFDITVAGAVAGAPVILGLPAGINAGIVGCALVSAGNTVTVRLGNLTAGAIDPAVGVYSVTVLPAVP